jgi:hypothetical protein
VSPTQDLMDRLAAADPVDSGDRLSPEQQREADALLERLLAIPATSAPARPGARRHWPRLAVATAVAAAAVFVAVSLLGSDDGPAPNVVAEAVAALTQKDAVYHAEFIAHMRTSIEPRRAKSPYVETWHTIGGRLHWRDYVAKDGGKGRLVSELAGQRRPGRLGGPALMYDARTNQIFQSGFGRTRSKHAPTVDPFNPGNGLKELQAEGRLRVAGEVEIGGRRAYRLVSGDVPAAGHTIQRTEIIVDAETYLPIRQRLFDRAPNGESAHVVWNYLTYERLPLNDRTTALLGFDPPAGAKCAPHTDRQIRKGSLGFPNPCAK